MVAVLLCACVVSTLGYTSQTREETADEEVRLLAQRLLNVWDPDFVEPLPDGTWAAWSSWSECSVSCGGGAIRRERMCIPPHHGGADCPDSYGIFVKPDGGLAMAEQEACNEQPCPVGGVWNTWEEWSICGAMCGDGTRVRHRMCVLPMGGGQDCVGDETEESHCDAGPCEAPPNPW